MHQFFQKELLVVYIDLKRETFFWYCDVSFFKYGCRTKIHFKLGMNYGPYLLLSTTCSVIRTEHI